jgi:putative ABC transport system permease protein
MDNLWQDLRFGFRMLVKHRGLTATSVMALALGVGLTTAMFSIVYGAFLKGLPFEEQDELMHLLRVRLTESREYVGVSIHDFADWRAEQTTFDDLAAYYTSSINVSSSDGLPERYQGAFVTANTFEILGIKPLLGRNFRPDEDRLGADPIVIIGYTVWKHRYNRDPSIIGRSLRANGETMTVVGVMPERFEFPNNERIWIPLRMDPLSLERGRGRSLEVIGRLKDGISLEQASAEMAGIARRLEQEYPETNRGLAAFVQPYIHRYMPHEQRAGMLTMLGAVFGVLLIACVNVANLLLARTVVRSKEIAVRSALGASRSRLVSQMLVETFVISIVGAGAGLGVAYLGLELFNRAIVDNPPPFWMQFRIDPTVVGFVVLLTFVATVFSGIAPALRSSGAKAGDVLKDESRGSSSLRLGGFSKALVVAEIALSSALLVTSGFMVISIVELAKRQFPFSTTNIFKAHVALFESDYPDEETRRRFFHDLQSQLEALPRAEGVSLVSDLPGLGGALTSFAMESVVYASPEDHPRARSVAVTPATFDTFGVDISSGRGFHSSDGPDSPKVAIVNESFAEKFFLGESPLGRRIRREGSKAEPWMTIVGVVPDIMTTGMHVEESPEGFYVPLAQSSPRFATIAVRVTGPPLAITTAIREAVMSLDPNLPIFGVSTLARAIENRTWYVDVFGSLFAVFGLAALVLAGTGLYGVMAFDVSRRVPELGLRMSLGARRIDLIRLILEQGLFQLSIGLITGLALGWGLSALVEGIFYGVRSGEPSTYGAIALVMTVVGVFACLAPVHHATSLEPATALRYE